MVFEVAGTICFSPGRFQISLLQPWKLLPAFTGSIPGSISSTCQPDWEESVFRRLFFYDGEDRKVVSSQVRSIIYQNDDEWLPITAAEYQDEALSARKVAS